MPISNRLKTKIRLTMLCLSVFELYSRWVPLTISDSSGAGTKTIPDRASVQA